MAVKDFRLLLGLRLLNSVLLVSTEEEVLDFVTRVDSGCKVISDCA